MERTPKPIEKKMSIDMKKAPSDTHFFAGWPPPPGHPSVVTIGNFDGFHVGHQFILRQLQNYRQPGWRTLLMTFEPHPATLTGFPIRRIQSPGQRYHWLYTAPVDLVWVVPFSFALLHMEPEVFIESILFDRLDARVIVVGDDFRFGYQRRGDVSMLRDYAKGRGARVISIEMIHLNGIPCHSSEIRTRILSGDIHTATQLLGRPFALHGTVARGEGRGRVLGYPTANLIWQNGVVPKNGVYATITRIKHKVIPSITHVGHRPTFSGQRLSIETHLFQSMENLYGESLEVFFIQRIRDEHSFPSITDLQEQIRKDIEKARNILHNNSWLDIERLRAWPPETNVPVVTCSEETS